MCPTHVDKKVTHRARPPRRKRRLGDLMDSTEIQRVTGVFSRIDSNKYYTRQEVGELLELPRGTIEFLCNRKRTKDTGFPETLDERGRIWIKGADIIRYLSEGQLTVRATKEKVIIPHSKHPGYSTYKEAIQSIEIDKLYTPNEISKMPGLTLQLTYALLSPREGRPPRFKSQRKGRRLLVLGEEVRRLVYTLAKIPVERVKLEELSKLLLSTSESIEKSFFTKRDKSWFVYEQKKSGKLIFYPLYQDLANHYWLSQKHYDEIKNDITGEYVTLHALSRLFNTKKVLIKFKFKGQGSQRFYVYHTMTKKFEIPLFHPWSGETYFDTNQVRALLDYIQWEKQEFISSIDAAAELGIKNPKNLLCLFYRNAEDGAFRFSVDEQKVEVKLNLGSKINSKRGGILGYFRRDHLQYIRRYLEIISSKTFINLRDCFKCDNEAKTKSLGLAKKDMEIENGKIYLRIGERTRVEVGEVNGRYYVHKSDRHLVSLYHKLNFSSRSRMVTVRMLKDLFEGKTLDEIKSDGRLAIYYDLLLRAINQNNITHPVLIDPTYSPFSKVDLRKISTQFKIVNGHILITDYGIRLSYIKINGNAFMLRSERGLLHLAELCERESEALTERFMLFVIPIKKKCLNIDGDINSLTKPEAIALLIFKDHYQKCKKPKVRALISHYMNDRVFWGALIKHAADLVFQKPEELKEGTEESEEVEESE